MQGIARQDAAKKPTASETSLKRTPVCVVYSSRAPMLDRTNHKMIRQRARQKRFRRRQARGVVVWSIEITASRFDNLVRLNYLRADATSRREGALAVEALLDGILP
jgi:hypothetical protein